MVVNSSFELPYLIFCYLYLSHPRDRNDLDDTNSLFWMQYSPNQDQDIIERNVTLVILLCSYLYCLLGYLNFRPSFNSHNRWHNRTMKYILHLTYSILSWNIESASWTHIYLRSGRDRDLYSLNLSHVSEMKRFILRSVVPTSTSWNCTGDTFFLVFPYLQYYDIS